MHPPAAEPLLERDAEVALLEGCLNNAAEGSGSTVVIEGAGGLGKTRLLDTVAASARERGFRVLRAGSWEQDHHFGFGVAVDLLESVPRSPHRAHPLTLLRILDGGSGLDAVFALHRRLVELAEDKPLLVAVDDAHWTDAPSLRWLLFAAQRGLDMPLAIVLTARPDAPGADYGLLSLLAADSQAHTAVLAPLSPPGTAALIDQRLPGASRAFTDACHAATEGNPFLLHLVLDEMVRAGDTPDDRKAVAVAAATQASLARTMVARLDALGAVPLAVARAVAVLGLRATLHHTARLAQVEPEDAVGAGDALLAASVFRSADPLRFVHPMIAEAVYDAIDPAERADLHLRAARLLAEDDVPVQRVATQLLVATRRGSGPVVEQLRAAAAESVRQGGPGSAARFLQRALDEPPRDDQVADVLLELGEAEALFGSESVVEHLEQALAMRNDPVERAEILARLGNHLIEMGQHARARPMFARALEEPGLPPGTVAALRTAEYSIAITDGTLSVDDLEPALNASTAAARDAGGPQSGGALTQLALAHVFSSRDAATARDLALRGLAEMSEESGVSLYASSIAMSCLIWCEELDVVEAGIAEQMEDARRRGAMMSMAYLSLGRSWTNYWRGRIAGAAADAGDAAEAWSGGWSMHLPIAAAWQALALVELDRPEEAIAAVDRVLASRSRDADISGAWLPHHEPLLLHARGRAEFARGNVTSAAEHFGEVAAQQSPFTHNPTVLSWRSDGAIAIAAAGDQDRARELANEELELARRFGSPRPIGVALRATALINGGDVDTLTQAVTALERSPARIELLRALVDLGIAQRHNRQRVEARATLRRALNLDGTTTAAALRRRASEELGGVGI